jgi:hypothetical protein
MYSPCGDAALPAPGFPIRKSAGQRLFSASPRLIAAVHVLHRLLVPRHPPCALTILTVISIVTGDGKVPGHGDTHLLIGQLCSFQGPAGGANRTEPSRRNGNAGAAGLSKLNSMCARRKRRAFHPGRSTFQARRSHASCRRLSSRPSGRQVGDLSWLRSRSSLERR